MDLLVYMVGDRSLIMAAIRSPGLTAAESQQNFSIFQHAAGKRGGNCASRML